MRTVLQYRYFLFCLLLAVFHASALCQDTGGGGAGANIASRTRLQADGARTVEQRVYDNGLDTYDYGARQYDPILARWDRMDPLAEKDYQTSPYVYCGNNPVNRIDKDGRIWDTVLDVAFLAYDAGEAAYQYCTTGSVSTTTKAALGADALAAVVPGLTGTGLAVRAGAKAAEASRGLKNAKAIAEGIAFEKAEFAAAKASGENVASHIRLVPQNGIGNVNKNRSTVDQLIMKENGQYKVVENKLREGSSKLSKGQQRKKDNIEMGNTKFEVRSDNKDDLY